MNTELLRQITDISEKVKEINGGYYAEQFSNTVTNLFNKHIHDEFNEYQIIIEALHTLIESDYKDRIIEDYNKRILKLEADNKKLINKVNILEKDNIKLKEDNIKLKEDNIKLKEDNIKLKEDNIKLKADNINLTNKVTLLEQDNQIMKNNKNKFDALVKLHECNALVNKEFKRLYKIKFNKKKGEYIPNIGDFIIEPPTEEDGDDYIFWLDFNEKYPRSNDKNFRLIYQQINNDRTTEGAHINVSKLTENDFDKLIEFVYPLDYSVNKKLYNDYRNWLFMFPV
jgi:hypothetical protein